uniref:Transmembrane protein n=1 Tax=Heterorhabditis bacteriophora TaxID=37862 RepID=A0A1I7WXN1_HETBA
MRMKNRMRRSFFLLVEDFFQKVLTKMLEGGCILDFKDVIGSLFTHIGESLDIVQFDVDGCRWFGGKAVMECLLCAGNSDRIRIVSIVLIGAVLFFFKYYLIFIKFPVIAEWVWFFLGSSCCSSSYFVNSLSRFYASTQEFTHDLLNSDDRLLLTVLALLKLERHIPFVLNHIFYSLTIFFNHFRRFYFFSISSHTDDFY